MHRALKSTLLCAALFAPAVPAQNLLSNSDFENGDLSGWNVFGNAFIETTFGRSGTNCGKLFGNFSGGFDVTGIFQQFPASEGDIFSLDAWSQHITADPMIGAGLPADNWVVMKIAFFDAGGGEIAGAEQIICDGTFPLDTWIDNPAVVGTAPANTTSVQALILYLQPANDGGAVFVDDIEFSEVILPPMVVPEGAEPNDPTGTPTPIRCTDQGEGVIDPAGDDDAWTFTLDSDALVQLTVTPGFAAGINDSRVELLDATGASIGDDDDGGDGLHPLLTLSLTAGTYTAIVDGFGTNTGSYTLDVICYQDISTNPIVEGPEPNDTTATATPIALGDSATGDVNPSGDDDWYELVLTSTTDVVFETSGGPAPTLGDTRLELFDATGTTSLAFDDDGGSGLYSLISINLAAGTYYINVDGFGSNTGQYVLTCIDANVGLTSATYGVSGTGCPGSSGNSLTILPRTNERPYVGSVFVVEVTDIPETVAFGILGFIDQSPPVELTFLGAPGCFQNTDIAIAPQLAVSGGSAEWALSIPVVVGLAGIEFNQQILAFDAGANAGGVITSNYGEGTFGERF